MKLLHCTSPRSLFAGFLAVLAASLAGCGGGGSASAPAGCTSIVTPTPVIPAYQSRAACALTPHQSGRAKWTILVYMQAANNLQPYSLQNVAQMAQVGSDADVNVVLQWKQIPAAITNSCPNCDPSFYGVRRYYIRKHSASDVTAIEAGNTTVLQSDRLPDPPGNTPVNTAGFTDTLPDPNGLPNGTQDMGSYKTLANFVQWGTANYPADNYAVLIWDHGSGWQNVYRSVRAASAARAVAVDDETTDEIETWELPAALSAAVHPLSMVIFDASLEQMTEVAYEIRNNAKIMVGSEESPPAPGYPYNLWLADLEADSGNDSPCDLGNHIIQEFVNYPAYVNDTTGYAAELTQSMVDLSQMNNVAAALNNFAGALNQHVQDQASLIYRLRQDPTFPNRANGGAQHYTTAYRDFKDAWDYADLVRTGTSVCSMQQTAAALENSLIGTNGAILESQHGPTGQDGSHGLSIYVPDPGSYLSTYSNLALSRAAPLWPRFLISQVR